VNAPDSGVDAAQFGLDPADWARLRQLEEEQAAARRLATLVAGGIDPVTIYSAVAEEVCRLLGADSAGVARYEPDGTSVVVVGGAGDDQVTLSIGLHGELLEYLAPPMVWRTGRSARVDQAGRAAVADPVADRLRALGIRSVVGSPIIVGGRLWGVLTALTTREPFPSDAVDRMTGFTELAATAIGTAQAENKLRELAETQAALRRLAMLVARGEPPEAVFAAATTEALRFSGNGTARMIRFEPDGTATLVANEGATHPDVQVGERWEDYPPTGLTATVRRTGRAARVDDYSAIEGGEATLREGIRSALAVPIHVNGRLWGMIAVGPGPLPPDLEQRMEEFTDLVATAVANAQNRAELIASRARIVAASDETRRRIERDLHDGAQQHLLALALRTRMTGTVHHSAELTDLGTELISVIDELREICRGIHPAMLSDSGLRPALRALGRRSAIPVDLDLRIDGRLPEPVEVGAYYVISEILTNAAKHAHATAVEVDAVASDGALRLRVRDDGIGGADPLRGSGLVGLRDRIEALGGTFSLHSPPGGGTTVFCELPLATGAQRTESAQS
jgi:signal transduction histidine kinase